MRILRTADRLWRSEEHRDGWRLYHLDMLMLRKATRDEMVAKMIDLGGRPEDLAER